MKKNILYILAVCAMLLGCNISEMSESMLLDGDLHAIIDNDTSTKTVMDESNNIRWSENDQIVAFMKTSLGLKYKIKDSYVGKTSGYFSQVTSGSSSDLGAGMELDHNVAYYPYSSAVECAKSGSDYILNVVLPDEQTYVSESFGQGTFPMVAVSEDNNITFRNVLGGMKLQLKGTQKITSIKLQGKNNEKLSGAATVTCYTDNETKPAITMASAASTSVTLNCDEGVQLNENSATEFIIALPPMSFSKGFTVTITDAVANTYTVETDKSNTVLRSSLLNMPIVSLGASESELITIVETYYDGYKAHITVPQETKDRNHAIRAGSMPLSWYYLMTSSKGQTVVDLQAVASNGSPYEGHMFTDSTIVLNDNNVILLDAKGNPVLDENNEQIDIHDPIVPGEPTILIAGETFYGTPEEFANIVGYPQPTKDSWAVPYYDPVKCEWLGAFQKREFFTKEPTLCDATVEIEIPEDEITVTDAMIYFDMSDDAYSYFYMVLDNSTYNQILYTYLNGNEDWYRWLLTSYIGFYEWGIFPETWDIAVNAASSFVEPLTGGETYHVLATVFGDSKGATQRFIHKTFKAKDKTKVAPVIDVTAIESSDPYSVTFNIKAGVDSRGNVQPIMGAFWVCNYPRDFELMFNSGYTYATLLKNFGWTFSSEEIAQVNSPEGLTVTVPTLDGEVTRFAAYGCNDEYTFNVIDEEHTAGWADCKSPFAESVAPVSSELFTLLEGDWTASAKLRAMQQEPDGSILTYHVDHKSKINISASAPELPATLDESVYGLYSSKSREDVDNMFEELKELSDLFTESRLVGQNRLLCSGFMDFDPAAPQLGVNRLEFRSPYDLFVATDYSSVDVSQLIYDFGPKWFLQIQEDGSVIVPFHSMMLPPMSNWPGYAFYTGGVADGMAFYDSSESYPGFPVEISDDLNTITVKPIVLNDGTKDYCYYMNAIGVSQQGYLEIISTVITDIVLTRGWTETAAAKSVASCPTVVNSVNAVDMNGSYVNELPKAAVYKSMTEFKPEQLPSYTVKEKANVVTKEMVDETSAKILRKYNL